MTTSPRASTWSITINNPTDDDIKCTLPPGWVLEGQFEEGTEGTPHFQGLLKTPQVRFSAVKRQFPRAHIEVARNVKALQQYVHKEETRVGEFQTQETMNIFQLQDRVIGEWDEHEWLKLTENVKEEKMGDMALAYTDSIVSALITNGMKGIEFTAVNPMWRSSWKRFWRAILARFERQAQPPPILSLASQTDSQENNN